MSERKSITLNGQTIHGNDMFGHWRVNKLEGWFDSAPPEIQDEARAQEDGDRDLPVKYGARLPTATGRVICTSEAAAVAARNRITGLVTGTVRLQVTDGPDMTGANVKLNDIVTAVRTGRMVRFQFPLRAPDPRRYGPAVTFTAAIGAPVTVSHRGTYPAIPEDVTIRGDSPAGYTVTLDGWNYVVTVPLTPGVPHRIDYRTGVLRVNGVIRQNSIGTTNLAMVAPGPGVGLGLYRNGPTGTGTVEMTVPDTYI